MSTNEEFNPVDGVSPHGAIPADLQSLELQLAALRPRTDRLDRDRLMFLAGQASAASPARTWLGYRRTSIALAAMTAVAATLLVLLVVRSTTPQVLVVERIVEKTIERLPPDSTAWNHSRQNELCDVSSAVDRPSLSEFNSYLQLRGRWLAGKQDRNDDAAPATEDSKRPKPVSPTYRELRDGLLTEPAASMILPHGIDFNSPSGVPS